MKSLLSILFCLFMFNAFADDFPPGELKPWSGASGQISPQPFVEIDGEIYARFEIRNNGLGLEITSWDIAGTDISGGPISIGKGEMYVLYTPIDLNGNNTLRVYTSEGHWKTINANKTPSSSITNPGPGTDVPLDGGLSFLLLSGLGFGVFRKFKK